MVVTKASEQIFAQANANVNKAVFGNIIYNVKAYGAKGDGVTDDTATIKSTISAASLTGGIVLFPPGTYIVASSLGKITKGGVYIKGSGPYATIIRHTSDTQDLLQFGDVTLGTGYTIRGVGISDITIQHNATRSAGNSIACENAQSIRIRTMNVLNAFTMFRLGTPTDTQGIFVVLEDVTGECVGNGVGIDVQGGTNGIHLLSVQLNNNNLGTALKINPGSSGMDTLFMDDCLFQRFNFGILVNGSSGIIQNVFIQNSIFDGIQFASVTLSPTGTGIVTRFHFVECWFTSYSADAVVLDAGTAGNTDGVYFDTCRWVTVKNRGLVINSGNAINVSLVHCILSNCSTAGSGLYAAIETSPGCKKFYIRDCIIGQEGQTTTYQSYGIKLGPNNDLYQILNNVMLGNITGAISDSGGTFTKKLNKDNLGYNPTGVQTSPAIPASTVAQANNFSYPVEIFVGGGTVQGISKNGINTFVTSGHFILSPGETIAITYTGAPAWAWFGL